MAPPSPLGAAGLHSLGYVVVETTDLDRWTELAVEVLGMVPGTGPDPAALYLRVDDRPARVIVHAGRATAWSPSVGSAATPRPGQRSWLG